MLNIKHRRAFAICALVPFLFASPARARGQTLDELKQSLLPVPHKIEVVGQPKAIGGKSITAICGFAKENLAFDPLGPLAGTPLVARVTHADDAPLWAVAFRDTSDAGDPCEVLQGYANAAKGLGPENYLLMTAPTDGAAAVLIAGGPRGLLYAAQTLAQLAAIEPGKLPGVRIEDGPDVTTRELHVHGFDKGYGAGDFKTLDAYTRLLPSFMPSVAAGRFNLFRLSIDAAWINNADRWTGKQVDSVMRDAVAAAHRCGVEMLIEVRLEGQDPASDEPKTRPMNPLTEWNLYETALRRAVSWGPDVVDFSCNDLGPLKFPGIKEKYGVEDGRFSGVLMADLLKKVRAVLDQERPETRLRHLPRFYGEIHWKRYPQVMEELWSHAPKGIVMYTTTGLVHPLEAQMREKYGASFAWWVNYSSNHAKELRVILDAKPWVELAPAIEQLPPSQRNVLVNLGYPVEPQRTVALATGEWLWNQKAYDRRGTLARAARQVWGKGADATFMKYDDLLDYDTTLMSLGARAADLLVPGKMTADEEAVAKRQAKRTRTEKLPQWQDFVSRAQQASSVARQLEQQATTDEQKKVANILYWNAQRVLLDSKCGVLIASPAKPSDIDADAVEALLREHEQILREHYPIEKNDEKSAEVVTRGIRRMREALKKRGTGEN
jgi:hypothetical protein